MLKFLIQLIVISLCSVVFAQDALDQKGKDKQSNLLKEDSNRKAKILEKYNNFYSQWKKRFPGLDFKALPMEPGFARDIIEHNAAPDSENPNLPKVSAFVTEDSFLRWEPNLKPSNLSQTKVKRGEAVEIVFLLKKDSEDKIDSLHWALIRNQKSQEGYFPVTSLSKEKSDLDEDFETRLNRTKVEPESSEDSFTPNFEAKPGRISISPNASVVSQEQAIADYFKIPLEHSRYVSSSFGTRIDPVTGKAGSFHSGIDMPAPVGTPIRAVSDGKVYKVVTTSGGYGMLTILSHKDDIFTYYAHQKLRTVGEGKMVRSGEMIGEVGLTGKTTGAHLHFEVRKGKNKEALDPKAFLPR